VACKKRFRRLIAPHGALLGRAVQADPKSDRAWFQRLNPEYETAEALGRAEQVDPKFDRAWFQRLNPEYDDPLSNFAFNFNMRRYR
jgi:hypothetical protein